MTDSINMTVKNVTNDNKVKIEHLHVEPRKVRRQHITVVSNDVNTNTAVDKFKKSNIFVKTAILLAVLYISLMVTNFSVLSYVHNIIWGVLEIALATVVITYGFIYYLLKADCKNAIIASFCELVGGKFDGDMDAELKYINQCIHAFMLASNALILMFVQARNFNMWTQIALLISLILTAMLWSRTSAKTDNPNELIETIFASTEDAVSLKLFGVLVLAFAVVVTALVFPNLPAWIAAFIN